MAVSLSVAPNIYLLSIPKILKHLIWSYQWQNLNFSIFCSKYLHLLSIIYHTSNTFFQCPTVSGLSHREDCLHKDSHWALKLWLLILCFEVADDDGALIFWYCRRWRRRSPWANQSHRQHWIQDLSCPSPSVKILRISFTSEYCKSILLWVKIFVTMMLMHLFKFYSVDRHWERLWSASRNSAPRARSETNIYL